MGYQMIEIRLLSKHDCQNELLTLSREFFAGYESHHEDFFKIDHLHDSDILNYFSQWIDNENLVALLFVGFSA